MKILVIDDDFTSREILKLRLEHAGYEVTECADGDEGLQKAFAGDYALVLLDGMMPKRDGWQVCKLIKANPKTKNVPVVILSAKNSRDEMQGWECGADDYLSKPLNPAQLLESIKKLTENTVPKEDSNS